MASGTAVNVSRAAPVVGPATRGNPFQFYVWMGYVCAFIAIVGFIPTYWAPVAASTFGEAPLLHVHGLIFSAWPLLFITQARLAAAGRFEHHRSVGYVGIALVSAMLFVGTAAVIYSLLANIADGFEPQGRAFAIVPLSILLTFVALVAAGVANVRRREVHMRLMLAAAVTLLPPAFARILFFVFRPDGMSAPGQGMPPGVAFALVPSFIANILLVVAIGADWRRRGRPHAAYLAAGAFIVAIQLIRIPVSRTAAWHAVTTWLLTLNG
jgi:hypothetical protein